ncbi:hypothetical protein N8511_02710 [Akkermansiaceae bacterium]|nr:hypothetical protein [Akkermansiaceae bacterium]
MSLYLGIGVASSQAEVLTVTGAIAVIGLIVVLGRRTWLLIPLVMLSNLFFRWIPGNMALRELAFLITIAGVGLLFAGRKIHFRFNFGLPHILAIVVIVTIVQVYLRHPTGLAIFGAGNVGGRPYFLVGLSIMGSFILSTIQVPPSELIAARRFAMVGGIFTVVVQWLAYIPGLGYLLTIAFGTGNMGFMSSGSTSDSAGRNMAGAATAESLPNVLVGYADPLKALYANRWTILMGLALFGTLISGFRSRIALTGLIFAFGVFYWNGIRGVIGGFLIAVISLIFLIAVNAFVPLPGKIQRTLAWLPGSWEQRYIDEGTDSTDWRVEIWEEALLTDRWIENKVLGDGLGFTAAELSMQQGIQDGSMSLGGFGGLSDHQISVLVNGDYHSGPVSLVRTIGYVGLAIFMVALLVLAASCHNLMRRHKGHPYFGILAMFLIPAIAHPIYFLFIFGGFSQDFPLFFLNLGLYGLLRNNFASLDDLDELESVEDASQLGGPIRS